jgi:DNA-binding IclR family transcriptional regulator
MSTAASTIYRAEPAPSVWVKLTGPSTGLDVDIIKALSGESGLLMSAIMARTGASRPRVNSRLQVLRARGVLDRHPGHPGKYYLL